MTTGEYFSLDDILEGMPSKRAQSVLFLIQQLTAKAKAEASCVSLVYVEEKPDNLAFLDTLAEDDVPDVQVSVADIEQYAAFWENLVPESPRIRASLARLLGEQYRFPRQNIPAIRRALGLDTTEVQGAFQKLYGVGLESIYATHVTFRERLQWGWQNFARRLETLPPFWAAFAMTLTETVGAGILALPIALAEVGLIPGLVILILLGVVNMLTIGFISESLIRSGALRYQNAFYGRVVSDYLGRVGTLILSLGILSIIFLALWAYYIGLSTTLTDTVGLPPEFWAVVILLSSLYFLTRGSIIATVSMAILIGFMNILLLVILALLAVPHIETDYLSYTALPLVGDDPLPIASVGLIFGVVNCAYFGHLSVGNSALMVLRRDPGGRSLLWGGMFGIFVAIVLNCIWWTAIAGLDSPENLAAEQGTSLVTLIAKAGDIAIIPGTLFVILAMGMTAIHFSLSLFNLTKEWLPHKQHPTATLARRTGSLHIQDRHQPELNPQLNITYLGLDGGGQSPRFRFDVQNRGKTEYQEESVKDRWDCSRFGVRATFEILDVTPETVRLRFQTDSVLSYDGERDRVGLNPQDLMNLPEEVVAVVRWMMASPPVRVVDVAHHIDKDYRTAEHLLNILEEDGLVSRQDELYSVRMAVRTGSRGKVADKLLGKLMDDATPAQGLDTQGGFFRPFRDFLTSQRGSTIAALMPVFTVFGLAQWSLMTGNASFSEPLGFLGTVVLPVFAGLFPVLLLRASRLKGDLIPATSFDFFNNPIILGGIYIFFLVIIALHGLVIWENPIQRGGALGIVGVMLWLLVFMYRRNVFSPRLALTLMSFPRSDNASLNGVAAGSELPLNPILHYRKGTQPVSGKFPLDGLESIHVSLANQSAHDIRVWAQQYQSDFDITTLPVQMTLTSGNQTQMVDFRVTGGQALLPLDESDSKIEFNFKR